MNARKLTVRDGHGRIGVTAATGRSGRGRIGSATRHATAASREETAPIGGRPARDRDRQETIASAARHVKAGRQGETVQIADQPAPARGRRVRNVSAGPSALAERDRGRHETIASAARRPKVEPHRESVRIADQPVPARGRRVRSVSAGPIGLAALAAAVRRDSEIGHDRRVMATGRAASIGHRAIDQERRRGIEKASARDAIAIVPARRASPGKGIGLGRRETAIATARGRRVRLGTESGPGRRAIEIETVRGRRVGRGRLEVAVSGRRAETAGFLGTVRVAAALAVDRQARVPREAHPGRRARRGRRVTAIVRLASGATTSSRPTTSSPAT